MKAREGFSDKKRVELMGIMEFVSILVIMIMRTLMILKMRMKLVMGMTKMIM